MAADKYAWAGTPPAEIGGNPVEPDSEVPQELIDEMKDKGWDGKVKVGEEFFPVMRVELSEPPEAIEPLVEKTALEKLQTRLKEIFDEQKVMFEKQTELRTRLKAIRDECTEEETEHETMLGKITEDKEALDTLVDEACVPVMELHGKTGDVREKFAAFDDTETELLRIANESTTAGEAFQRVPTVELAGRLVAMSGEKIKEALQEVGAGASEGEDAQEGGLLAFSSDLQVRVEALKVQLDYQDEETKVLWEELLEKQRSVRRAAPYEASLVSREKEEEVFARQQAELQVAQRLLGYVLKKAAEYAEPRESLVKGLTATSGRTVDVARYRARYRHCAESPLLGPRTYDAELLADAQRRGLALEARYEAVIASKQREEKRLIQVSWLQWRATFDGMKRLKAKHDDLLKNAPTEEEVLIEPFHLADRLAELEARVDAVDKTKLTKVEYNDTKKKLDEDFKESTKTRDDCVERLKNFDHAQSTRIELERLFQEVSTLSQEMAKLEAGVQEEEAKLYLCASVDGVQKLIGQVISIWTAVKEADKGKADRRELEKVGVAINAAWQNCASAGAQPESLVGVIAQPTEKRIEDCKAAIDSNKVHFTELEGILTGVAAFVEETVRQLKYIEHA